MRSTVFGAVSPSGANSVQTQTSFTANTRNKCRRRSIWRFARPHKSRENVNITKTVPLYHGDDRFSFLFGDRPRTVPQSFTGNYNEGVSEIFVKTLLRVLRRKQYLFGSISGLLNNRVVVDTIGMARRNTITVIGSSLYRRDEAQ